MKKKKNLLSVVVTGVSVLILMVLSFFICTSSSAQKVVTLKLGDMTDLTGPGAPMVAPIHAGRTEYFKYLNETGGIKVGKKTVKFDIVWADTGYRLPEMLSAYERFKAAGVIAVSMAMSPALVALKERFAEDKIPCMMSSGGTTTALWPVGWVQAHMPTTPDYLGYFAGKVLKEWKKAMKPRFALLVSDDAFGRSMLIGGPEYCKEKGIEIVAIEPIKMAATSATEQLLRIQKAEPDYIYTNVIESTLGVALKDAKRLGIKIPFVSVNWNTGPLMEKSGGKAVEGMILVGHWLPLWQPEYVEKHPKAKEIIKIFQRYHPGERISFQWLYGYTSSRILDGAIRLALEKVSPEKLDGAALKKYGLDRIKDLDTGTIGGTVTYTPEDRRGSTSVRMGEYRIVEGVIKDVYYGDWEKTPTVLPPRMK